MLALTGHSSRLCSGLSRRAVLQIGALGLGGLALPQLLAAEERTPRPQRHKSVIMI